MGRESILPSMAKGLFPCRLPVRHADLRWEFHIRPDHDAIIEATRRWISSIVIGLDLCPFARRVFRGDLIRYAVSEAVDDESLRTDLANELEFLVAPACPIETTLLIHPHVLQRFDDYCYFLDVANSLVRSRGLRGVVQIASFHPRFQFAGAEPDAVENYTNRSPFPMLHLLREQSISDAVDANAGDVADIPKRNAAKLRSMGLDQVLALQRSVNGSHDAL